MWVCDQQRLEKLIIDKKGVVVLGITENQNNFIPLFNTLILLQCKPEVFIERINNRKDNDFGKDKTVQDFLLHTYKQFESSMLEKGAISINTDCPLNEVVGAIIIEMQN